MSFINSYKRLEKLCNDMYGTNHGGVTCYIKDMEKHRDGNRYVKTWNEDYKQLKYYRHIRNMIVHDVDCEEKDMCDIKDTKWINNFYKRILNQSDPLALYRKHKWHTKSTIILIVLIIIIILGFIIALKSFF